MNEWRDPQDRTPLHLVTRTCILFQWLYFDISPLGDASEACMTAVLDHYRFGDFEAGDHRQSTPLHYCAGFPSLKHILCFNFLLSVYSNKNLAVLLLQRGARNDVVDADGNTPLQVAEQSGNIEMLEILTHTKRSLYFDETCNQEDISFSCSRDDDARTQQLSCASRLLGRHNVCRDCPAHQQPFC